MTLQCVIVDDEFANRDLLRLLIGQHCRHLRVSAMFSNVKEAAEHIRQNPPDVVFLDVEMPGEDGFALFQYFPRPDFRVVFVTAYEQYAVKAIKKQAFDFLLKPVATDELISLENRLMSDSHSKSDSDSYQRIASLLRYVHEHTQSNEQKVYVPTSGGFHLLNLNQIEYVEADGNYSTLHLADNTSIFVTRTIGEFEQQLPWSHFFRCHKSYLVNLNLVTGYSQDDGGVCITKNNHQIPVSRRKVNDFMEKIHKLTVNAQNPASNG